MNRAAVVIGVQNAKKLPPLRAALDGAKKMAQWAGQHGFAPVVSITDETEPVTAKRIKDAVRDIVRASAYQQLFIYFAGHGVNQDWGEYWLLTDVLNDTNEAVNVAGSVHLAKRCGIPHVVIVSDACRTAPQGIRMGSVRGSEIFPPDLRPGPQRAVDVFYASLLGEPALEIPDTGTSVSRYVSLYTDELVAALSGERKAILSADPADQQKVYLRPHPLRRHLTAEVPKLVAAKLGATADRTQTPDAEILSDETAFLQTFDAAPDSEIILEAAEPPPAPPPPTVADVAATALRQALDAPQGGGGRAVEAALQGSRVAGLERISEAVIRERDPGPTMHFETDCGFKVQGVPVIRAWGAPGLKVETLSPELVRVYVEQRAAANVLIELGNGSVVVLPALRDFLASLTFENDELRNVSYEPSDQSRRWADYQGRREELTAMRALIASSVQMGTFRLERDDAPKLAERIRTLESFDPTMALYAAYSYHRLGELELIRDMESHLADDLGVTLFDLALLSDRETRFSARAYPETPMLAHGWSLLGAYNAWTPRLEALRPHVLSSLWTVFKRDAISILERTL
jgi:hypothetical protein